MAKTQIVGQLMAFQDAASVSREAATQISLALRGAIDARGRATIALSGGNTPREAYALLGADRAIDWSRLEVFWVDERAVAPTSDRSNYRWAKAELLDTAGVPFDHVHRMPADAEDADTAAQDYERAIRENVPADAAGIPQFDVVVLGVGDVGHTASLFPGETCVDFTVRLVVAVPASANREARMTITAVVIEHARHVVVLAVGTGKRAALERVWSEQGDLHDTPARVVRRCRGKLIWVVDRLAAPAPR